MRPWRHEEQTLTFLHAVPPPLGDKRKNFLSVQLPPAWMKGSDKTDQDFKVGILNEDRRNNTNLESRVEATRKAGTRLARFFYFFFFYKDNFYLLNKILLSSVPVLFTL